MQLADAVERCQATWSGGDQPHQPGVVLVACTPDDAAVRATGLAVVEHGVPLTPQTRIYAASLAKIVTALCVHRLVEAGRLDIDDPVGRWLPSLGIADDVTILHLLLHRSGLPEYHALRLVAGYSVDDRLDALDVNRLLEGLAPLFVPGSRVAYCNTNYALLARVVEAVTGAPFGTAAGDLVVGPAGMTGTVVRDRADLVVPGAAAGYVTARSGLRRAVLGAASMGDGGMWWSGQDLAALGQLLLAGDREGPAGGDSAVRLLRQRWPLPDGSVPNLAGGCSVSAGDVWFGGLAEFTGFRAELRVYPTQAVAIGAMANRQDAEIGGLLDDLAGSIGLPAVPAAPPPAERAGPLPTGTLVTTGGAAWRFAPSGPHPSVCTVEVGGLSFGLEEAGARWRVQGRPAVTVGWEADDELVVRDGGSELARLRAPGGDVAPAAVMATLAGWWWCAPARATLVVESAGEGLVLRRGQQAPDELVAVGDRDGRWVFATSWGLIEIDHDGLAGRIVLPRAEGLPMQRLAHRVDGLA